MRNYGLRITNYEWEGRNGFSFARHLLFVICFVVLGPFSLCAQQVHIATFRPDRAGPGMNVVMEILAPAGGTRPFGYDSLDAGNTIVLVHPADSDRVVFGPPIVSWNGNLIQVPLFVLPNSSLGPVPFYIRTPPLTGLHSDTISFLIDTPQHLGTITRNVTIGNGFGMLSAGNTLLVDSLIVTNGNVNFSLQDPDTLPGNPRLQPVTILSKGPVRLTNATISVDADSLDGGPGGGGGGHGFPGAGGTGFTGGGSSSDNSLTNTGSAANATLDAGGACATGVMGGGSEQSDQGGGGGTGAPYGTSGKAGVGALNSEPGGFGGGSGGGEATIPFVEYGGGGGGFGTAGTGGGQLGGISSNDGLANGGRFLVPLAGGSGGGAGNSVDLGDSTRGGSGGGGGGAIELVGFDSIVLTNSTVSARGDSGTMGAKIAAGGGGGSGGAIYLASPVGVLAANTHPHIDGGTGGPGKTDTATGTIIGFPGGMGGLGRIRIDGSTNLIPIPGFEGVWSNGISLSPHSLVPSHGFVHITGFAQDTINSLDSIRIYYRTRHSAWQFFDTVRAQNGSWSKWLPLSHDSLMFVAAMVMVSNPASDGSNYDYEPSWLVSDVSLSVLPHPASAFLVSEDTLNFGTVRVGRCKTLSLRVANDGEEPLIIAKGAFSGSPGFSVVPNSQVTILPYTADTFQVQFCPDSAKAAIGTLSFASNDSVNSPKTVTLLGTGLALHDSLVLVPTSLRFDRVVIDSCATDTVSLLSAGTDTLYLSHSAWNHPPFSLKIVPPDTALAPKQTRKLLVTFCPLDSGNFLYTQILDERGDSIAMSGFGVLRRAASTPAIDLGTLCLGHSDSALDVLSNLGNDTISVFALAGHRIPRESIGLLLQPNARDTIRIPIPTDTLGSFTDTISFELADTVLTTALAYNVVGASLSLHSPTDFRFFACVGSCDTGNVTIILNGPDTLVLSNFGVSSPFALLDSTSVLIPGHADTLKVSFCPSDTLEDSDMLRFHALVGGCDSELSIRLHGFGTITGIATAPLDFDSILDGECVVDSMLIANPCGPTAIIDSVTNSNSDFQFVSPRPDTLPVRGTIKLAFRFCPTVAGKESDTATLFLPTGERVPELLKGRGILRTNPWAHFTISDTIVRMGDQAVTFIRFDSSSLKGMDSIRAVVSFDPTVLSPVDAFPSPIAKVVNDSEAFSEVLNFEKPGLLNAITWNTLAGPRARSEIEMTMTTDTPLNVIVQNGSVTLTDCNGLAGRLASSGSYALGPITPDPVAEKASVMITLGGDGYVEAAIYDMTGRLAQTILQQSFTRGSYQLTIPTDGLSSGRYVLEINSMGWRAISPFMVNR